MGQNDDVLLSVIDSREQARDEKVGTERWLRKGDSMHSG